MLSVFIQYKEVFLKDVADDFPKVITMLQQSTYIACFTESVTSPVMWAHYTDNHKGFAIEYRYIIPNIVLTELN